MPDKPREFGACDFVFEDNFSEFADVICGDVAWVYLHFEAANEIGPIDEDQNLYTELKNTWTARFHYDHNLSQVRPQADKFSDNDVLDFRPHRTHFSYQFTQYTSRCRYCTENHVSQMRSASHF